MNGAARTAVLRRSAAIVLLAVLAFPLSARAQSQVRVISDGVTIWKPGFTVIATTAKTGDVFEVVALRGNWYEIIVPSPPGQPDSTGFIAATRVEPIGGGPPPPRTGGNPARTGQASQAPRTAPAPANRSSTRLAVQGGYGWFMADQGFEAVNGSSGGPWFGGGLRYDSTRNFFVEGSLEYYRGTGERVFVFEDTIYRLGIENKVSILPLMLTGGFSLRSKSATTYVGGGAGAYFLRESAEFTEESEDLKETSLGYRAVAGVLFPLGAAAAGGVEVQYNTVPNGLEGGAAAAFDESNLGGFNIVVKFLFGR